MNKEAVLHIRVSKWRLEEIKRRSGEGGVSMTEYVEGVLDRAWEDEYVGAKPSISLSGEKFSGESERLQKAKGVLLSKEKELGISKEELKLDMDDIAEKPHFTRDEDLPEDNLNQSRVIGRHKR